MNEEIKLLGHDLIRKGDKWVACFGEDYVVHFTQPTGCGWSARKPFALEPIAHEKTLALCLHNALRHYEARSAETRERVARKLADPIVQKALARG
jgi:hypothetical protein